MSVRRDRKKQWRYRKVVKLPDGKSVRISGTPPVNTKESAELAEHAHILRVLNPVAPPEKKEVPTFAAFAEDFIAIATTKNKPSEVATKQSILRVHLHPYFGAKKLDQIGYAQIQDYVGAKLKPYPERKTLAKKSINNHLTILRRLLVVAKKRGLISAVPEIEWLRVPKPSFDFLSFEESKRLLVAAEGQWACMIMVALRTGLRQGELLALRWEDVDLVSGKLNVRRSVTRNIVTEPKSGKGREIPLGDEVLASLKANRHLRGPLVFCAPDGRMLKKNECKHPLRRAYRKAGLRKVGWHMLRHTFASHLVMVGVALKAVQELLGHATVEMTMRYAHLSPNVPREAVKKLDTVATGWQQQGVGSVTG